MDIFMDRLPHKKSSQEMIQANSAADAAKMEQLQRQVTEYDAMFQKQAAEYDAMFQKQATECDAMFQKQVTEYDATFQKQVTEYDATFRKQAAEYDAAFQKQAAEYDAMLQKQATEYDTLLQDMRKVNLRAAENMEQMQQMLEAALKKIEAVKEADETKDIKAEIEGLFTELKKQMEEISLRSDDFQHKENVKVYRNVQASMAEELEKQTSTISQKIGEGVRKQGALVPVSIIIMLMVIIDIVINLFNIVIKL